MISSNFDGVCVCGRGEPQSLDHRQAISAKIRHSVITLNVTIDNQGEPSLILNLGTKPRLIYDTAFGQNSMQARSHRLAVIGHYRSYACRKNR